MNASFIAELIFGGFALLAALAGALGFTKAVTAKAMIGALREEKDELRKDVDDEKRRVTELKSELQQETLRREALEKVVTGEKQLEELASILHIHDNRAADIQRTVHANFEMLEKLTDGD